MSTGKTLQSLRKLKGKSQREIADKLDITQQAYSKLERREWIDIERTENILQALKSSRKELEEIKKIISSNKL